MKQAKIVSIATEYTDIKTIAIIPEPNPTTINKNIGSITLFLIL
jgi:hypothetical protein